MDRNNTDRNSDCFIKTVIKHVSKSCIVPVAYAAFLENQFIKFNLTVLSISLPVLTNLTRCFHNILPIPLLVRDSVFGIAFFIAVSGPRLLAPLLANV